MAEETHKAPLSPPDLEPGTVVAGYVIDNKLGEGGMGVVYRATHPRIGKRVAIKVLTRTFGDPAALERFEQEAQFVNAIRHPNIVDVFQFGELPDGRAFFVMELLEGESVAARLEKGPIHTRGVVEILDEVCDALEAAHEKNVIHRDLKADNVFLVASRRGPQIKLLDFGLAKLTTKTGDESGAIHKTRSGILVGTPAYVAPEQARGKGVDARTDIYSLGVLAYKMLTGKLPYIADTAIDLVAMHLSAPVPNPRELAPATPQVLARLVMRMMAKERADRPSVADVRQVLGKLREGSPSASGGIAVLREPEGAASSKAGMNALRELRDTRPPPRASRERQPRRLSLPIVLSVFLCGVIVFGVIGIIHQRTEPSDDPTPTPSRPEPTTAPVAGPHQPAPPTVQPTIEMEPETAPTHRTRGHDDKPPAGSADKPAVDPKAQVGMIVVLVEVASEIEIDGASVATASRGGRYEVQPGKHTVRIKLSGGQVIERTVDVTARGSVLVQLSQGDFGGSST